MSHSKNPSIFNSRILTLTLLALAMATIIVAASHADTLDGNMNKALDMITYILTSILDVIVDFIGKVLDEIVRALHDLF